VKAVAIDLALLKANAEHAGAPVVEVSREWLSSIHDVLTGRPFVDVSVLDPAERQARILAAIDKAVQPGAISA
jgi:hypothetical protein